MAHALLRDDRGDRISGSRSSSCLAWPLALYLRAPAHLIAWWSQQSVGDFLAAVDPTSIGDATFLAKNIPWYAWPALPLVLWTLYTRGRGFNGGLATPGRRAPRHVRAGDRLRRDRSWPIRAFSP